MGNPSRKIWRGRTKQRSRPTTKLLPRRPWGINVLFAGVKCPTRRLTSSISNPNTQKVPSLKNSDPSKLQEASWLFRRFQVYPIIQDSHLNILKAVIFVNLVFKKIIKNFAVKYLTLIYQRYKLKLLKQFFFNKNF